jgi:hypothetical protein
VLEQAAGPRAGPEHLQAADRGGDDEAVHCPDRAADEWHAPAHQPDEAAVADSHARAPEEEQAERPHPPPCAGPHHLIMGRADLATSVALARGSWMVSGPQIAVRRSWRSGIAPLQCHRCNP